MPVMMHCGSVCPILLVCSYIFPEALNIDYGQPVDSGAAGLCKETAPNSGVFVREYTKATVQMDCNSWKPTITMKHA